MNNSNVEDILMMRRCFELARLGSGMVSPNPMVGSVIVQNGSIVGEGWHEKYGGPHAEVNAVNNVKDKGHLENATLYVNLEPCAHFGKTPPCADLVASLPISSVVICNVDPNPLVQMKGIEKLRSAGKNITVGVLENEGLELNKRFFTHIQKKRPYIILKWAQTSDGYVARENFDSKWISNERSRILVHKWRSEEDCIMVGTNTANFDNPQLTVRDWSGRHPVRIVIDKYMVLDRKLHLFDGTVKTLCYNFKVDRCENNLEFVKIDPHEDFVSFLISDLHRRKYTSLFVEGGSQLLGSLIRSGMWDEARVFKSSAFFGSGIKAPDITKSIFNRGEVGGDELILYKNL